MGIDRWLIHTCTIRRDQSAVLDDYNADVPNPADDATGVKCRMVIKMVREPLAAYGEGATIPEYRLFVPAGTDVHEGDEINTVLDEDGNAIAGTWNVRQVLKRRARTVRHITVHLDKIR